MSRFPGWTGSQQVSVGYANTPVVAGPGVTLDPDHWKSQVTPAMIDEAVAVVAARQELPAERAAVFENMAVRDTQKGPAAMYFNSRAVQKNAINSGVNRPTVNIPYALTVEEVAALTAYAPEYQLTFNSARGHDHPAAAASRVLDHMILMSRCPPGVRLTDIGGNAMVYVRGGNDNVHVCGQVCDRKDPSRYVTRRLQAKMLAKTGSGADPSVAAMASRYLQGDSAFVCNKLAQDCAEKSPLLLAVHVYDIDLDDWPGIMDAKGASCVEGCLLYVDDMLEMRNGVMGLSGARFEVDPVNDTFCMGFVDSPSWWYEHKWTKYMRYGFDHTFQANGHYYTYKVVERRADTLFYRIIRAEGVAPHRHTVAGFSPKAKLVRVDGFDLNHNSSQIAALTRKTWWFPYRLWNEMVAQASEDFQKGVMDWKKMYRYYRTVSVRQTINAVLVVGGEPVSEEELVPLVVHSCIVAALQTTVGSRETRAVTDAFRSARAREDGWLLVKVVKALASLAVLPLFAVFLPFKCLADLVETLHIAAVEDFMPQWQVSAQVKYVEVLSLRALRVNPNVELDDLEQTYLDDAKAGAFFDSVQVMSQNKAVRKFFSPDKSAPVADAVQPITAPPSYRTDPVSSSFDADMDLIEVERKTAISEHLVELRELDRATMSASSLHFDKLYGGNRRPNKQVLEALSDDCKNPDIWKVVEGVLVSSERGLGREDFAHSAVYSPALDHISGSPLVPVISEKWTGEGETHINYMLAGGLRFTGDVMVTDLLTVYNGQELYHSLEQSLELPHRYVVTATQAPPGCGKTYTIKQKMRTEGEDAFMCPVKLSADSTRSEFVRDHAGFRDAKTYMRTLDSYLANVRRDPKSAALSVQRLMADEAYMSHAGKWYAAAALLGVDEVCAYGDLEQIPHVSRVGVPAVYKLLREQISDHMWMNYRNPPTALAAWGHIYDHKLRAVKTDPGVFAEVKSAKDREIVKGTVMMCMYQAGKVEIRKLYPNHLDKIQIMTSNESEGKTFERVWLHKFDVRPRTDGSSLYDNQAYALVAASRHTKEFLYVNPGAPDTISGWVAKSHDPRRLAAVKQQETAGQSLEFL